MDSVEEVCGVPVVLGCEPPAVFHAAQHALDGVAALVESFAEAAFPRASAFWRDVGDRTSALDQLADAIDVVSTVGVDDAPLWQVDQQVLDRAAAGCLPWRQVEGAWPAVSVGDGVNLGVATTPTAADRLRVSPPLPPAAERCAFTFVLANEGNARNECLIAPRSGVVVMRKVMSRACPGHDFHQNGDVNQRGIG